MKICLMNRGGSILLKVGIGRAFYQASVDALTREKLLGEGSFPRTEITT